MAIQHSEHRRWPVTLTVLVAIILAAIAFVVGRQVISRKPALPVVRLTERTETKVADPVRSPDARGSLPQVLEWRRPQADWLYVVNEEFENSRVVLVDPDGWQVRGAIQTGENVELVRSPDGERLYLLSYHDGKNWLEIVDSQTARLEHRVPVPKRTRATIPWSTPMAVVSGDGRWLFYLRDAPDPASGQWELALGGFELPTRSFAAGAVPLKGCGSPVLVARAHGAGVLCRDSHELLLVDGMGADDVRRVELPKEDEQVRVGRRGEPWRVSGAAASNGGRTIYLVTGVGRVWEIDGKTGSVESSFRVPLPDDHGVATDPAASPGGDRLYFGVSNVRNVDSPGYRRSVDKLAIVDVRRQSLENLVETEASFWSPTVASDGTKLYATTQEKGAVILIELGDHPQMITVRKVGRFISSVTEAG